MAGMDALAGLRAAYLQGSHTADELVALARALPGWPSESVQARLDADVLDAPEARRWPPAARHTRAFLRALVRSLEADAEEEGACEALLVRYAALPSALPSDHALAHRHFRLAPDSSARSVVVRCTEGWGGGSETGGCLWDGGMWLAEYAAHRCDMFRDRTVLELGAGCGLLSCVLAAASRAAAVVATDGHSSALANCKHNLEANGLRPGEVGALPEVVQRLAATRVAARDPARADATECHCARLDWEDVRPGSAVGAALAELGADVVLGADCVYDASQLDALARTLAIAAPRAALVLLALKRRNELTRAAFDDALRAHGLAAAEEAWHEGWAAEGAWRKCDAADVALLRIRAVGADAASAGSSAGAA